MVRDIPAGDGKTANLFFTGYTDLHLHPELEDAALEAVLVEPGQVGHSLRYPTCRTKVYFRTEYINAVRG